MSWVNNLNKKLEEMADGSTELKKHSIYKIPAFIANLNPKVYMPHAVSFGPYHHDDKDLQPMERHKERSLLHFMKRTKLRLQSIVDSFTEIAQDLKDSYDSLDEKWQKNTEEFMKLMIVDGCFMLEIFRAGTEMGPGRLATQRLPPDHLPIQMVSGPEGYDIDDPVFGKHGKLYVMPVIRRDMLMLENQLPLLVLEKLIAISGDNNSEEVVKYINNLILKFCNPGRHHRVNDKCCHVLDIYRKSLFKTDAEHWKDITKDYKKDGQPTGDEITRSAAELHEAGVRFERTRSHHLNSISFKGGVLKLPTFVIDDTTESTVLNMIAFERCHVGAGNEVTSYICFMDNLIDGAVDIRLLQWRKIVKNFVGSDKGAANLFNNISKDLTIDPDSSMGLLHCRVTAYCAKRRNRWRANLIHTYFTNPWTLISVIAAAVLFALTITQTVYSALGYYQQQSPSPHP